jgi:hypothetical protein
LSIGKPVVVQGEAGFSLPFRPDTLATFLWQGFWGIGDGAWGSERLADHLEALARDSTLRARLGDYGRKIVVERFSLRRAADIMEGIYAAVAGTSHRGSASLREAALVASRALLLEVEQHRPSRKRERDSIERARLRSAATTDPGPSRSK